MRRGTAGAGSIACLIWVSNRLWWACARRDWLRACRVLEVVQDDLVWIEGKVHGR